MNPAPNFNMTHLASAWEAAAVRQDPNIAAQFLRRAILEAAGGYANEAAADFAQTAAERMVAETMNPGRCADDFNEWLEGETANAISPPLDRRALMALWDGATPDGFASCKTAEQAMSLRVAEQLAEHISNVPEVARDLSVFYFEECARLNDEFAPEPEGDIADGPTLRDLETVEDGLDVSNDARRARP